MPRSIAPKAGMFAPRSSFNPNPTSTQHTTSTRPRTSHTAPHAAALAHEAPRGAQAARLRCTRCCAATSASRPAAAPARCRTPRTCCCLTTAAHPSWAGLQGLRLAAARSARPCATASAAAAGRSRCARAAGRANAQGGLRPHGGGCCFAHSEAGHVCGIHPHDTRQRAPP
jgi:hypothetical protein